MFRKKKEAFAYDSIALDIARNITNEEFLQYKLQEQSFLVLPFEHSENCAISCSDLFGTGPL